MSMDNGSIDQLKGVISNTLEHRGVLAKIRAELRQHVFLALEEQESASITNPTAAASLPAPTRAHLTAKKQRIAELHREPFGDDLLDLVRDFLSCYQLEYTQALLNTEADVSGSKSNRKILADKYNLSVGLGGSSQPLLLELLKRQSGESSMTSDESRTHSRTNSFGSGSRSHSRSTSAEVQPQSFGAGGGGGSGYGASSLRDAQSNSPPEVLSPDSGAAGATTRSSRALYRDTSQTQGESARADRDHDERQQAKQTPVAASLDDNKLSPGGGLLPPSGGLGALAPLGSLKKPSLGSLAPLAPLTKPSLGALSKVPPPSMPERKSVAFDSHVSDDDASPRSSGSSPRDAAAAPAASVSRTAAAPPGAAAASSAAASGRGSVVDDELDLDALEAEFGGGNSASGQESFIPSAEPSPTHAHGQLSATKSAYTAAPASASSSASSSSSSSKSSLSSLSAAPSLRNNSSLSSLAPLAPLGGRSLGGGSGGSQWGTRSSAADDESHDSVSEEDARKVAALDAQIAHLTNKSAGGSGGGSGGGSLRSADRSADDYDDSFVDHDATPAEQSLEEDIEYASDEEEAF